MQVHSMWQEYPTLEAELAEVLSVMEQHVHIKNKKIEKTLLDFIHSGGKLLRPAYSLLFSAFGDKRDADKSIAIAAAVEVLHMATLIHDDVIDDASTRRNQATIQSTYGKDIAVYAGDYLFVVCFKILAKYATSIETIEMDTNGMEKILTGELDQMDLRYRQNITMRQYLSRISGKTAQLFALSCYAGAYESGTTHQFAKKCYYIGSHIGMAFQILDDILDYTQSATTFGKPVLEDVRQGVYTSPLIFAMKQNRQAFEPYLSKKDKMTAADIAAVQALIVEYKGVEQAQQLADKYTKKALNGIKNLPSRPEKKLLLEVTSQLLRRQS